MARLSPLDASWLYVESPETPMHVANLSIFVLPEGAPPDYLAKLVADVKDVRRFAAPWNLRLRNTLLRGVLPEWVRDDNLDLDYHVRHSALPRPGGERELGILVSRLHSHPLALERPLWECHVIEGLENNRFALYTKIHHALIDGVGGMRLLMRALKPEPQTSGRLVPLWSIGLDEKPRASQRPDGAHAPVTTLAEKLRDRTRDLPQVGQALRALWRGRSPDDPLTRPFASPRSILNQRINGQRRFATQQYEIARLRRLASAAGVTLNDVVLAICAAALRRFLKELNALPRDGLTAGLPVSVRARDDARMGTSISFILASLGTTIADPVKRLQAIHDSTLAAKDHLQALPREAMNAYTMLLMGPYMAGMMTGIAGRTRPMFNLGISNVPGPEQPLYFGAAKLEAMYPVSVLTHGQALNITCVSYAGSLNFGFTGARDALPHMQRLSIYTGEALEELEAALAARDD